MNIVSAANVCRPGEFLPLMAEYSVPAILEQRRISIGEVTASARPVVLKTLLGSCVAVCLYDPLARIGGMNHILLPRGAEADRASRFGVHAMELLINKMMKLGGSRTRFVAKAFGAGNVLTCLRPPTVGDLNAQFVRAFLAAEGIRLVAQRLGGSSAVDVRFQTDTGRAMVHSVDGLPLTAVLAREEACEHAPLSLMAHGQTTLF